MTGNTGLCPKAGRVSHLRAAIAGRRRSLRVLKQNDMEVKPKALLQMLGDPDRDNLERAYRG